MLVVSVACATVMGHVKMENVIATKIGLIKDGWNVSKRVPVLPCVLGMERVNYMAIPPDVYAKTDGMV